MASYFEEVKRLLAERNWFEVTRTLQKDNDEASTRACLALRMDNDNPKRVSIEKLDEPSIKRQHTIDVTGDRDNGNYMTPLR